MKSTVLRFRRRAFAEEQVDDGEVRNEGEAVGEDLFVYAACRGAPVGPERFEGGAQVAVVRVGLDVGVAEAERRRSTEYSGDGLQQGDVPVGQESELPVVKGFETVALMV